MKEAGNLEGILLTGLTKDGVDLMESYVDHTGDVQTASFCMLRVGQRLRHVKATCRNVSKVDEKKTFPEFPFRVKQRCVCVCFFRARVLKW